MKQALFIGAFASILTINSVMADTTVTSKQYVDTTRQATIPAAGTNASTPGTTVVTYTNTAGTIGERGIYNMETDWDDYNDSVAQEHKGDLLPAEILDDVYPYISGVATDLQLVVSQDVHAFVSSKTCTEWVANAEHTDANCLLWNLSDKEVIACVENGGACQADIQCCHAQCVNGRCTQN